jgi:hypothetical protein
MMTPELASWGELFVVMNPGQGKVLESRFGISPNRIAILGDLDPIVPDRREIPDPLDRSEEFFASIYERMDRCLAELIALIRD